MLQGGVREGNESWIVKSLVCLEASGSRSLQSPDGPWAEARGSPISPMGSPVLFVLSIQFAFSLRAAWVCFIGGLPFGLVHAVLWLPLSPWEHPITLSNPTNPGRGIGSTL
jgi:hypothetical protein